MSFLKPTESSLRRAQTTLEEQQRQTTSANPTPPIAGAAQLLHTRNVLYDNSLPDYTQVPSRVDSGLRSRVQASLARRRDTSTTQADPSAPAPSLRAFNSECDSVIQRAQEMLDRTRQQELLVVKALEKRLSQSPARRASTPSPPLSQSDSTHPASTTTATEAAAQQQQQQTNTHTPTRCEGGLSSFSNASPALPAAPPSTPMALTRATEEAQPPTSASSPRCGLVGWLARRVSSSPSPPPSAPPPTPVEPRRTSAAADFNMSTVATATMVGSAKVSDVTDSSSSPSLLQRIRRSLQSTPCETMEGTSPAPLAPDVVARSREALLLLHSSRYTGNPTHAASPRKSVTFVSPDRLESVTPTKVVVFPDSNSWCDSDEEEEEEEDVESEEESEEAARTSVRRPRLKRPRQEQSQSATPRRTSTALPPAPPPSAVRSPARQRRTAGLRRAGSRSPAATPPSPSNASSRTQSPATPRSTSTESRSGSRTHAMRHEELKAYVMQHTIRQSLANLSKKEMKLFLKEEGSALAREDHVLKKRLLAEIRTLIRNQAQV
ncbi:hypothetical protein N2W54_000871 [Lotmaria passim]